MTRFTAFILVLAAAGLAFAQGADLAPTPASTEGPYYKAGSPQRAVLYEPGDGGKRIRLTGRVLDRQGRPLPGAWIDVWQSDEAGSYDNRGFAFRGHVSADSEGVYEFQTILPGEYSGRTPHIHVKVRSGSGPVLTTQLYFPEAAARNRADSIFNERLLVGWDAEGTTARFDFVLP